MTVDKKILTIIPLGSIVMLLYAAGFNPIDYIINLDWKVLLGIAIIVLGAWALFGPKRTKHPMKSLGVGDMVFGLLVFIVIAPIAVFVIGFGTVTVAGLADWASGGKVQNMVDITRGVPIQREASVHCNLDEYLSTNGRTIPAAGMVVTVCPSDGTAYLMAEHRKKLKAVFDDTFAERNDNVLRSRHPTDFFVLRRGGGTANSFILTIDPRGFRSAGLSHVKLFIRSVN